MTNKFEIRFTEELERAATWIGSNPKHNYGEFGSPDGEAYFMLQQTRLVPSLLNQPDGKPVRGIHLKRISIPEAMQRRRYATKIIDRLLSAARAAGMGYVFVESVVTDAMHALMKQRTDFIVAPHFRDCYIAILNKENV